MNIDWSKAPEGCLEVGKNQWDDLAWLCAEGYIYHHCNGCMVNWKTPRALKRSDFDVVDIRPEKPLTGEGLPPVGAVCEYNIGDGWYECKVRYVLERSGEFSYALVAWCPHLDKDQYLSHDRGCTFRPIRTPEQIAEEARLAELNLMIRAIKDHPGGQHGVDHLTQLKIHEEACINLYDAGWRKQVAQ